MHRSGGSASVCSYRLDERRLAHEGDHVSVLSARRARNGLASIVVALATVVVWLVPAAADARAADTHAVGFTQLGQPDSLTFAGSSGSKDLQLPVPDGLTPARLQGTVTRPADATASLLEVSSNGRLIARLRLTKDVTALDLPLTGALVANRAVSLHVASRVVEPSDCGDVTGSVVLPLTLRGLQLQYSGSEKSTSTIATFLPPALAALAIYVPADADQSVRAGAVSLAGAIAARYAPAPVAISVRTLTAGAAIVPVAGFLGRSVVVTGTGDPGLELLGANPIPTLGINGDATALPLQVGALTRDLGRLAQASAATATRIESLPGMPRARQSIDELGIGSPSSTGLGAATVSVGLSQAQLGAAAESLQLRLVGSSTLADGVEPGVLTVSVNGRVLATWAAGTDPAFVKTVTVPWSSLGRYVSVDVTAAAADQGARCGDLGPVTLSLDGSSSVTSAAAPRPFRGGFAEFPAVLRPTYQVATDSTDVAGLNQVVGLVAALQRMSAVPLSPVLVDVATVASSNQPALLVATKSALPTSITLPLEHADPSQLTLANGNVLKVDADIASLQVVEQPDRTLLVATSVKPSSSTLPALLSWAAQGDHLGSLSGDVLAWPADADRQNLAIVGGGVRTIDAVADPIWERRTVQVLVGAVVIALLAAVIAVVVFRTRPGRPEAVAERRGQPRGPDDGTPWVRRAAEGPTTVPVAPGSTGDEGGGGTTT